MPDNLPAPILEPELPVIVEPEPGTLDAGVRKFLQRVAAAKKTTGPKLVRWAMQYTKRDWNIGQVKWLLSQENIKDYLLKMQLGGNDAARDIMQNDLAVEALWAQSKALKGAVRKKDWKAVAALTSPVFTHSQIKPSLTQKTELTVNVTLSEKRQTLLESERPIIEAEIVPDDES